MHIGCNGVKTTDNLYAIVCSYETQTPFPHKLSLLLKKQYTVIVGQEYGKGKSKLVPVQSMKAYLRGGIAPLMHAVSIGCS